MKKKTKKPIFDSRAPGGKMIVYGAVLVIIGGVINSYMAWLFATGALLGAVETGDVMGYTVSLCLQTALSLIVALDGINNRNRPSKGRKVMINAICVFALAIVLSDCSAFAERFRRRNGTNYRCGFCRWFNHDVPWRTQEQKSFRKRKIKQKKSSSTAPEDFSTQGER